MPGEESKTYNSTIKRLSKIESTTPSTLGSDAVYIRLIHALEVKRPLALYHVIIPAYFAGVMKRLLPNCLFDN